MKAKREKREREPSKSSLMCSMHFKPNDFVRSLDFKEEEGILRTPWLEQDEFGKILRNSSQSAQATETDGWSIVSQFSLIKCSLP